ncbi:hypothetical protein DMC63_24240 [Streptomyces sp. WAC 05977]|nr:hypothetical protein DMC63_24240 [Streptomyces sp. WAC 05977]
MLDDEKPVADVADQHRLAHAVDGEPDEHFDEEMATAFDANRIPEADPADVADQRRGVPTLADREPWH